MRMFARALGIASAMLVSGAVLTAPLSAQHHAGGIGLFGGGAWSTDLAAPAGDGAFSQSWTTGLGLERWTDSGRLGGRLQAAYTLLEPSPDVNLYSGGFDLLVRVLPPRSGALMAPYIAVGAGAAYYDAASWAVDGGLNPLTGDPVASAAARGGVGIDFFADHRIGLRLEAMDEVPFTAAYAARADDSFGSVHHARATAGLIVRFGERAGAQPTLAFAPPPAPAEPEPDPEPDPAPRPEPQPRLDPEPAPDPPPGEDLTAPAPWERDAAAEAARLRSELGRLSRTVAGNTARLNELLAQLEELERSPGLNVPSEVGDRAERARVAGLYTVQVAAFAERDADRAHALADRLRRDGLPAWVARTSVDGRVFYRVRTGATPDRVEAERLGRRVGRTYGASVWIASIDDGDEIPAEAVVETRQYTNGS